MVEQLLIRVENRTMDELLCTNSCVGKEVGVPLIVTYHPHFNGLNEINTENLKHLQADQMVGVYTSTFPIVQCITSKVI